MMRYDAILAETVSLRGAGGDVVEGYLARPLAPGPFGSVVVIHHMPGYAVDCYCAFVASRPEGLALETEPVIGLAADLSCPLHGLLGGEDTRPGPEEVAETDRVLTAAGKAHEFHTYENAVFGWFERHLSA